MTLPTPTVLAPTARYIPAGIRRYVFVPTIATKTAPTAAEITAGTDITGESPTVTGFTTTSAVVDAPDFGSRYTSKVSGMQSAADSSITTYCDITSTDARELLTVDLEGFIVIFHEGIATGTKCSVFPVQVTACSVENGPPEQPATLMVGFAITSKPAENIATPSA